MPIIYFHVGGHKTGTTYLQRFLLKNRASLLRQGLQYVVCPTRDRNETLYGNGRPLFEFIKGISGLDNAVDKCLDKMLSHYGCSSGLDVFISDEDLVFVGEIGWNLIKGACERAGYKLRIVFVVRNPIEYMRSLYLHCLVANAEIRSPQQFISEERWGHIHNIYDLEKIFNIDELIVICYQPDVLSLMSGVLSIDLKQAQFQSEPIGLNVGVSESVANILLMANTSGLSWINQVLVEALSNYRNSDGNSLSFQVSEHITEEITRRYADDVDYLNERYLGGKLLKIPQLNNPLVPREDLSIDVYSAAIMAIFSLMKDLNNNYHAHLVAKLRSVLLTSSGGGELPSGFCPLQYLLLNKDVLFAGVDPSEHYLKYGCQEGRDFIL